MRGRPLYFTQFLSSFLSINSALGGQRTELNRASLYGRSTAGFNLV